MRPKPEYVEELQNLERSGEKGIEGRRAIENERERQREIEIDREKE